MFRKVDAVAGYLTALLIPTALVLSGGLAVAEGDFPLVGSYTQNVPCKGDGSDAAEAKVTISAKEIVSNIGTCTILDLKQNPKNFVVHVECKFPAGPLMGDITFTPRPDKTIGFVDRDKTYNAVLHRCPS